MLTLFSTSTTSEWTKQKYHHFITFYHLFYHLFHSISQRIHAKERYEDNIRGILESEKQEEAKAAGEKKNADYLELLKEAHILGAHIFAENAFAEDGDRNTLSSLPGMREISTEYLSGSF